MKVFVFDTEGDSLTPTKFHVVSYQLEGRPAVKSILSYNKMKQFLTQEDVVFIAHNGMLWDKPELERVLGIKIKARFIDTLFLSWYVFPSRNLHGLAEYGEEFGVPKPKVDDWENQPLEVYQHRCEEDVKINMRVWLKIKKALARLYTVPEEEVLSLPIIDYLMFKADCALEQQRSKWKLDIPLVQTTLETLYKARTEKVEALARVMPRVAKKALREAPAKPYKKDGTLSVQGVKWQSLLKEYKLPPDYQGSVEVVVRWEEPNPGSTPQVKDWLYSLGWDPLTFKYEKNEDGTDRLIPQIRKDDGGVKVLCPSVMELIEKEPAIEELDGLTVINHRISIFEGFLDNVDKEGFVQAKIQGLTNTLRFKHKVCVNLPGVDKPWGKEIRGALVARDGYELMGSDINSLEDMTKRHYIFPYDPKYVEEMDDPDYDAHLDLAIQAGRISKEDAVKHVRGEANFGAIRKMFKPVNYGAVYGIGVPKLAREMKVPQHEAKALLDTYWRRNWSIKKLAEDQLVKTIQGQMWLFNPVSNLWYSLRYDKDRFSTLNQGTGVYVFDTWLKHVRSRRKQMTAQFHDEGVWEVKKGFRDKGEQLLRWAMKQTNEELNLNVTIDIDVQFGDNYGMIH
jgi:hypothetical protein